MLIPCRRTVSNRKLTQANGDRKRDTWFSLPHAASSTRLVSREICSSRNRLAIWILLASVLCSWLDPSSVMDSLRAFIEISKMINIHFTQRTLRYATECFQKIGGLATLTPRLLDHIEEVPKFTKQAFFRETASCRML